MMGSDWVYPDTPKVFSRWERKINPFLRAEDWNPVFEAFVRRRFIYHASPWTRCWERNAHCLRGFCWACWLLLAVVCFTITMMFNVIAIIAGVLVLVFIGVLDQQRKKGRILQHTVLPFYIEKALNGSRRGNTVLLDLWMTGTFGREVHDAHLLEKHARTSWICRSMVCSLPLCFAFYYPLWNGLILLPLISSSVLLFQFMLWHFASHYLANAVASCRESCLKEGLSVGPSRYFSSPYRRTWEVLYRLPLLLTAVLLVSISRLGPEHLQQLIPFFESFFVPIALTGLLILTSYLFARSRRIHWIQLYRDLKTFAGIQDHWFNDHITCNVLGEGRSGLRRAPRFEKSARVARAT